MSGRIYLYCATGTANTPYQATFEQELDSQKKMVRQQIESICAMNCYGDKSYEVEVLSLLLRINQ
jgi:hypothetical protein